MVLRIRAVRLFAYLLEVVGAPSSAVALRASGTCFYASIPVPFPLPAAPAADALPPHCPLLPLRSLVIVAAGGRDLGWSSTRIATALFAASGGRLVQRLFHGGARGADQAIDAAAERLGWPVAVMAAQWARYGRAAGPVRNRQMLQAAIEAAGTPGRITTSGVLVVTFPGHRGTASLLEQAQQLQERCPLPFLIHSVAA